MRSLLFGAFILTLLPSAAEADDSFACLDDLDGPVIEVIGDQGYRDHHLYGLAVGTRIDARDATYYAQNYSPNSGDPFVDYPVDIRASNGGPICLAGAAIHFTNDLDITWGQSKSKNSAAVIAWLDNGGPGDLIFDGLRIYNSHDGIRPRRNVDAFWQIRNSWITYNRDDCIENDGMAPGLVEDSLFDGCYWFMSARNTGDNPNNNVVTVQNSLIRIEQMPGPFGHDDPAVLGSGGLYKTGGDSPRWRLIDNVFLVEGFASTRWDAQSESHSVSALGFRDSLLAECRGNTIVWTGPGAFPGDVPDDPACVTITDDINVWIDARETWEASHPMVQRIAGLDDPAPEPEPEPEPEPTPDPRFNAIRDHLDTVRRLVDQIELDQ